MGTSEDVAPERPAPMPAGGQGGRTGQERAAAWAAWAVGLWAVLYLTAAVLWAFWAQAAPPSFRWLVGASVPPGVARDALALSDAIASPGGVPGMEAVLVVSLLPFFLGARGPGAAPVYAFAAALAADAIFLAWAVLRGLPQAYHELDVCCDRNHGHLSEGDATGLILLAGAVAFLAGTCLLAAWCRWAWFEMRAPARGSLRREAARAAVGAALPALLSLAAAAAFVPAGVQSPLPSLLSLPLALGGTGALVCFLAALGIRACAARPPSPPPAESS